MQVLIIPDVHQTRQWEVVVKHYYNDFDFIIQIGDWFDTHDDDFDWKKNDPIQNFLNAVELTKFLPKFKICLGNHDFSYLLSSHCSQFQYDHYKEIRDVLMGHLDDVNIAYECDEWVISHAGFTKTWMKNNGFKTIEEVNKAFHEKDEEGKYINLNIFQFNGWDPYGEDKTQGPTWVRPESLYKDSYFKYQVVGHTPIVHAPLILDENNADAKKFLKPSIEGQRIIFIDNEKHDCFYSLDTEETK